MEEMHITQRKVLKEKFKVQLILKKQLQERFSENLMLIKIHKELENIFKIFIEIIL